jgi:hypothetical protein
VVIDINTETAFQNAEKLKTRTSSIQILRDALTHLKPDRKNILRILSFTLLEAFISLIIATQPNTIPLLKEVMTLIVSIIVALLAIVFTGYTFFQTLINDNLLITLLSVDINKNANLVNTNKYFAEVMILQIFCLLLNLLLALFSIILPSDWCLTANNIINESLAFLGIWIILFINMESIWEMKSFIFNLYQLYNLHAYSRMLEIKNKKES